MQGRKEKTENGEMQLFLLLQGLGRKIFFFTHHVLRDLRNQKNRTWLPLSKSVSTGHGIIFFSVFVGVFLFWVRFAAVSFVSRRALASVILEGSGRASSWRDRCNADKAAMHAAQAQGASHRVVSGGTWSIGGSRPHG